MEITSPVFKNNETIPIKYSCEGSNISPPLKFSNIPSQAKSLVLLVEDFDAAAKPWVHWVVQNIPTHVTGFDEASVPKGVIQGITSGNSNGYEGPCPPSGEHTYQFKLYALDVLLEAQRMDRKTILSKIQGHILAEAVLKGRYKRQKKTMTM